ncbi:MAG: heme exporter protein CcmD [Rhodospirillales bacterium]|nr:heme exporter protein CcmD [Rhodospirillales bacterium]
MGGYGRFVWPAFGLTVGVLVGLLIASHRSLKANETMLASLQTEMGTARRGTHRENTGS